MIILSGYLNLLKKIKQSLRAKDYTNLRVREFWKGLVRDSEGRWLKYHLEGIKYFQYGKQSQIDFKNKIHLSLIKATISQDEAFVRGLKDRRFNNFRNWLIKLHKKQLYNKAGANILAVKRVSQGEHSRIVADAVLPLASKYHDPYTNKGTQILTLPKIDRGGLPKDIWQNGEEVFHYYPEPKFFNQYLNVMKGILKEITADSKMTDKQLLSKIALYYQYGINMHMFENVNQSLFANQVNVILNLMGLRPIEHGVLDFAAMRLQPINFTEYFIDEVKRVNHKIIND